MTRYDRKPGSAGRARSPLLGTGSEIMAIYLLDAVKRGGLGGRLLAGLFGALAAQGHGSAGLWVLIDNHGYSSIGGLSQSVGLGGFGTRYNARDARTGELEGDVLPVDYAANARSLGARVLAGRCSLAGLLRDRNEGKSCRALKWDRMQPPVSVARIACASASKAAPRMGVAVQGRQGQLG